MSQGLFRKDNSCSARSLPKVETAKTSDIEPPFFAYILPFGQEIGMQPRLLRPFNMSDSVINEKGFFRGDICLGKNKLECFYLGFAQMDLVREKVSFEVSFKDVVAVFFWKKFRKFVAIQLICVAEKIQIVLAFKLFQHLDAIFGHVNDDGVPRIVDLLVGHRRIG